MERIFEELQRFEPLEPMERIFEELQRLGPLEPGEDRPLVFNDAVVIASLSEAAELKLKIIVGYHRIEGNAFLEEATE